MFTPHPYICRAMNKNVITKNWSYYDHSVITIEDLEKLLHIAILFVKWTVSYLPVAIYLQFITSLNHLDYYHGHWSGRLAKGISECNGWLHHYYRRHHHHHGLSKTNLIEMILIECIGTKTLNLFVQYSLAFDCKEKLIFCNIAYRM